MTDDLLRWRAEFPILETCTYLVSHSLGAMPRKTAVYGYIDLGRSQQLALDDIGARIQRWKSIGASGVFFDEAGADFGVDRRRQNAAVDAGHPRGHGPGGELGGAVGRPAQR